MWRVIEGLVGSRNPGTGRRVRRLDLSTEDPYEGLILGENERVTCCGSGGVLVSDFSAVESV